MCRLNFTAFDTTPGADSSPYSPPSGWQGDDKAYRDLMADRYEKSVLHAQQMVVAAMQSKYLGVPVFIGPHAKKALMIHSSLA